MKNIDVVNKIISGQNNVNERTVKFINSFYWKNVRSKMANAESRAISVKGFGTFSISRYNLYKNIYKLLDKIRNLKKSENYTPVTIVKLIQQNTIKLKALLKQRNEIAKELYDKRISEINS